MVRSVLPCEEMVDACRDEAAGFGALETERGCLPLKSLDVKASLAGLTASMQVRQTFFNACDEPLEATYIFPLPDRAAVTRFTMRMGQREVEGLLKERGAAREDYDRAMREGHRAAIAEEDRSGTFALRVGNIPPRQEVSVELALVGPLDVSGGEATFRFPLVVAPRYTSGIPLDGESVGKGVAEDTDEVPDASRVTPPVLLPGFPNPVHLSLEVQIDPAGLAGAVSGDWANGLRCSLHSVVSDQGPPWTLRLRPGERLDRDFILRIPVASPSVGASLQFTPAGEGPGTLAFSLAPPAVLQDARPRPREVVFVLDRSGSMEGWKIVAARRAVGRIVDTLLDQDRFTVIAFDSVVELPPHCRGQLVEGTNRQRWRMLEWLSRLQARGGTEIGSALVQAMGLFSTAGPCDRVLVLITDGQITGEDAVLRSIRSARRRDLPRICTLGIDRAVNAGFLRRLADLGGGTCDLIESEERLDDVMRQLNLQIGQPALTNVTVEPVDFEYDRASQAPARISDLFVDRPITIFARHRAKGNSLRLRVKAVDAQGQSFVQEVTGHLSDESTLKALWGRARVRELEDHYACGGATDTRQLESQIVAVSLECRVLSRFTAYVAVDRSEVVNAGGERVEIVQPVELPSGWEARFEAANHAVGYAAPMQCMLDHTIDLACLAPRASSPLFGALSRTRLRRTAPPADIGSLVAEIRGATESLRTSLNARFRSAKLRRFVELLRKLSQSLVAKGLPADEIEKLIADGEALAKATQSERQSRMPNYLNSVTALLDGLERNRRPERRTERFWT